MVASEAVRLRVFSVDARGEKRRNGERVRAAVLRSWELAEEVMTLQDMKWRGMVREVSGFVDARSRRTERFCECP